MKTYLKMKKGVAAICTACTIIASFSCFDNKVYAADDKDEGYKNSDFESKYFEISEEGLDTNAYPFMEDTGEDSDSSYSDSNGSFDEFTEEDKVFLSGADVSLSGIYITENDKDHIVAGAVVDNPLGYDLEYRWIACLKDDEAWSEISPWALNMEWLDWTPEKSGDYAIMVMVRIAGEEEYIQKETYAEYHKHIKDKCQTPYLGEGGGYLIGFETYDNPNQEYQYEMIVMDLSLLAAGSPTPWIYTTGQLRLLPGTDPSDGKTMWTVWQPEYGYYLTLFRLHDATGEIIDEVCYGFENIPVVKKSWETTYGYSVIEPYLDDILRVSTTSSMSDEQKLRSAYLYVVNNFTYRSLSANHPAEFTSAEYYAYKTMSTGYGNCYGFSAVFYYLALKIGYDAQWYCGSVGTRKDPHGWVEIGGLIYDTELERYNNVNLYGVTNGHPYKYWY